MSLGHPIPALPVADAADGVAYGTREFSTLDLAGNLVTFFRRVDP